MQPIDKKEPEVVKSDTHTNVPRTFDPVLNPRNRQERRFAAKVLRKK